jgi:hypothetical protein
VNQIAYGRIWRKQTPSTHGDRSQLAHCTKLFSRRALVATLFII